MKNAFSCFLFLACVFVFLSPVPSSASQYGIYVAPRFIYGAGGFSKLKWDISTAERANGSKQKHDDAFGGALALGVNFKTHFDLPLRAEVEYSLFSQMDARGGNDLLTVFASGHRLNKYSIKQKIDVQTLFFNFYADIPTETRFTPYLSAGLGMAFVSSKSSYTERSSGYNSYGPVSWDRLEDSGSSSSKRTTNFAWNAGAGLGIALVDNLTLDLAYRFAFLGEVKSKDITTNEATVQSKAQNLYMHQVMMGLRWEF